MRTRTRFVLGVILAALLPLALASIVSTFVARRAAQEAVTQGNLNTATQAAGRITAFLSNQQRILAALAQTVASTSHLTDRQIEAVLRNHVLDFAAFHELAIYGADGHERLAVRRGSARSLPEEPGIARRAVGAQLVQGDYYLADDLQPGVALGVPIPGRSGPEGALVAQLELIELWLLVDQIRIGSTGYALITDAEGRVLAAGNGPLKAKALLGEKVSADTLLVQAYQQGAALAGTRPGALGSRVLGAEVPLRDHGLIVAVEQPTAEAFATANALPWELALIAVLAGGAGLAISVVGSRRPLRAIADIASAVERVAQGDFFARASEHGDDELAALARDFNRMTVQLREVTEQLRRHERLSVFSRIAAGLAHDLKHPIKNIENQARLLTEMPDDARFRETFRRTVERDFAVLDRFLGNLHDLTQSPVITPVALDSRALAEAAVEGVAGQAAEKGVDLRVDVPDGLARLIGDRVTLERALKNLIVNAIEASPRGASVRITAAQAGPEIHLAVIDDGAGIPADRLDRLFEEFSTTKRSGKGLGLGLALTSRLVHEQGGSIECESVVGSGSTFRIRMPRSGDRSREAA